MNNKILNILLCWMAMSQPSFAVETQSSGASSPPVKKSASYDSNVDKNHTIPVITNEAEYAAWVRKNSGAAATSSTKSASSSKIALSSSTSSMK